jgi:hypothetical protein
MWSFLLDLAPKFVINESVTCQINGFYLLFLRKYAFLVNGLDANDPPAVLVVCLAGTLIKIKRPAHLSIVERLGGFWWCKGKNYF